MPDAACAVADREDQAIPAFCIREVRLELNLRLSAPQVFGYEGSDRLLNFAPLSGPMLSVRADHGGCSRAAAFVRACAAAYLTNSAAPRRRSCRLNAWLLSAPRSAFVPRMDDAFYFPREGQLSIHQRFEGR